MLYRYTVVLPVEANLRLRNAIAEIPGVEILSYRCLGNYVNLSVETTRMISTEYLRGYCFEKEGIVAQRIDVRSEPIRIFIEYPYNKKTLRQTVLFTFDMEDADEVFEFLCNTINADVNLIFRGAGEFEQVSCGLREQPTTQKGY